MPRLQDLQVSALLEAFARPDPTPGGGSASAIAGAIGTALLMMVAGLPKTRTSADAERVALSEARAALLSVRDRLLVLADTDTEAFNEVMAAYRLPKATEPEKTARKAAIQRALKKATDAPLETLRATAEAMRHAATVAKHGNRSAVSDVGVGIALIDAAATGAAANVRINLESLQDDEFRTAALNDVKELTARLENEGAAARRDLQ